MSVTGGFTVLTIFPLVINEFCLLQCTLEYWMLQDGIFLKWTGIHHYTLFLKFEKEESAKLGLDNACCIPMHLLELVMSGYTENNV